ncbi:MAG: multiprotein-bridging factor 1 family protein [Candidatus Parvarchaeota archaeon]|nr:multiprotein-bridging factor 1 family protein [Candidatus Rehaiarchaeum fermentans]
MNCELCGVTTDKLYLVDIEGSKMYVCEKCAKLGKIIEMPSTKISNENTKEKIEKESSESAEPLIRSDYAKVLTDSLVHKKLKIEDLARRLGVSESYLRKVFGGRVVPDENLAKKLEKILDVELYY